VESRNCDDVSVGASGDQREADRSRGIRQKLAALGKVTSLHSSIDCGFRKVRENSACHYCAWIVFHERGCDFGSDDLGSSVASSRKIGGAVLQVVCVGRQYVDRTAFQEPTGNALSTFSPPAGQG